MRNPGLVDRRLFYFLRDSVNFFHENCILSVNPWIHLQLMNSRIDCRCESRGYRHAYGQKIAITKCVSYLVPLP